MAVAVQPSSAAPASLTWAPLPAVRRTARSVTQAVTRTASRTAHGVSKALSFTVHGVGKLGVATAETLLSVVPHPATAPAPRMPCIQPRSPQPAQVKQVEQIRPQVETAQPAARPDVVGPAPVEALAPEGMVEDLARAMILYQRERRRLWYKNAGQGFTTGVCLGAAVGWIPAVALLPTSGTSSLLLWPAAMLGGGVVGGTLGATGDFHFSPARPDDLRKHIFAHFGVVPSRGDSAALVAKLKDAGVLSRTRFRKLQSLDAAAQVFADANLSLALQRRGLRILQVVHQESARRAPLLAEAAELWKEIEAIQKKPTQARTPEDQAHIHMLIAAAAQLNMQLAWLKPEVTHLTEGPAGPKVTGQTMD